MRDRAAAAPLRHELVGREREAERLAAALAGAIEARRCVPVLLTGDAGVGKSSLIEHVCAAAGSHALVIRGRCLSYGDGITFWPLVEALRAAAGVEESDDLAAARAKLAELLGAGNEEVFERLASAVGLSERQYPLPEVFWAARKLVEILSRRQPLVLVLEDLHWAEPALLDLVDHVAETAEDAAALILCVARPELLETRPGWERLERLALAPLSAEESAQVVDNLLGEAEIAPDARARIVEAADGNPLFVEQLLSMMVDDGLLRLEDGVWRTGELRPGWVPPTIHALLTARIDGLEREQRAVIDPASVIGHYFQHPALQELVEEFVREQVDPRLAELERKQFVRPDRGDLYRFDHVLIRDSVYDGLLKRTRATLHERFVRWADRVNGDRATEFEEILGYHLEQAHRYLTELAPADERVLALGADGARRLASAGRRAFVRGDMAAAANLLLRATSLLPPLDRTRLELFPDLGEALLQLGELAQAESLLEDAVATAELAEEPALAANARLVQLLVQLLAGETDGWTGEATAAAEQAIELCEQAGDDVGLARAWRLLAWIHGKACRYGAAADALARATEHARAGRGRAPGAARHDPVRARRGLRADPDRGVRRALRADDRTRVGRPPGGGRRRLRARAAGGDARRLRAGAAALRAGARDLRGARAAGRRRDRVALLLARGAARRRPGGGRAGARPRPCLPLVDRRALPALLGRRPLRRGDGGAGEARRGGGARAGDGGARRRRRRRRADALAHGPGARARPPRQPRRRRGARPRGRRAARADRLRRQPGRQRWRGSPTCSGSPAGT